LAVKARRKLRHALEFAIREQVLGSLWYSMTTLGSAAYCRASDEAMRPASALFETTRRSSAIGSSAIPLGIGSPARGSGLAENC
jgi:hypothetical protein